MVTSESPKTTETIGAAFLNEYLLPFEVAGLLLLAALLAAVVVARKEVRDVLAEINKAGVSILLVEHNLKVAMSLADRLYLMGKAYIGFSGTVQELEADDESREKYLEV